MYTSFPVCKTRVLAFEFLVYINLVITERVCVRLGMATEPKAATEDAKMDLFEDKDDDEFEINQGNNILLLQLEGFVFQRRMYVFAVQ